MALEATLTFGDKTFHAATDEADVDKAVLAVSTTVLTLFKAYIAEAKKIDTPQTQEDAAFG